MKQIIEQLFLFSKLDMNEFQFSPHCFDITRALSDIIEELADEYAMRGLKITINEWTESVFVYADVVHFRRVLINIFENSVRYKEKDTGRLEINVSLPDDITLDNNFIHIRFTDDGPGVNPKALPNLFNAFYRTDPSRHTKGSGLGLAISAKIIERSGGTIHAANGDNGGLSVIIHLPISTGAV
jgi:signal transduction histidine kinase